MWFLILWLHLQFEVFHSHFTHVVSRGRYIALRVGDTDKALYAVILKRGGNLTVRTALLDGLQGLATAIGMGSLHIMKCISHGSGADSAKGNKSKIQRENPLIVPADF